MGTGRGEQKTHGAGDIRRVAPDQAEPVSQRRRRAESAAGHRGEEPGRAADGSLAGIIWGGDWGSNNPPGMADKPNTPMGVRGGSSRREPDAAGTARCQPAPTQSISRPVLAGPLQCFSQI